MWRLTAGTSASGPILPVQCSTAASNRIMQARSVLLLYRLQCNIVAWPAYCSISPFNWHCMLESPVASHSLPFRRPERQIAIAMCCHLLFSIGRSYFLQVLGAVYIFLKIAGVLEGKQPSACLHKNKTGALDACTAEQTYCKAT